MAEHQGDHEGLCTEFLGCRADSGGPRRVGGGSQGSGGPTSSLPCRSPKEVGDVIALSDITPSGATEHSREPSPVGSRRGHVTPNLSRASSDVVSRKVLERRVLVEMGKGRPRAGRERGTE